MKVNKEQLNCDNLQVIKSHQTVRLQAVLDQPEVNLLCANANAFITSCRNQNGEARAEGTVRGSVLLENEEFDAVSAQQDFSVSLPCGAQAVVNATVQVDSCKLHREGGSAVMEVDITVSFLSVETEAVEAVTQAEDMELLTSQAVISGLVGMYNRSSNVKESIELNVRMPQIKQCLQASPNAVIDKILLQDDAVMVSGDIVLSVLYSCGDEYEPIAQVADRLPFSLVVDAPGVKQTDKAFVTVSVHDGTVLPRDNEQGEKRIIDCDLGISCLACVMRDTTVTVVTDAYCTEYMLNCANEQITIDTADSCRKQQSVRVMLQKSENMPPIARVCSVNGFVTAQKITAYEGGATINCKADFYVVYIVSGSGEIAAFNASEDFELNIDCPCNCDSKINAWINTEMLQAALLSGSKCEIRMVLNVSLLINNRNGCRVLSSIEQGDKRTQHGGICIYLTQQGDTLFNVGKQLGVSLDEVLALNPELKEPIETGSRITVLSRLSQDK